MPRIIIVCTVVLLWLLGDVHTGWACPLCKEALVDPTQLKQTLSTAQGYALSIGLLLAVPFGLVAGLILLIFRAQTRARAGASLDKP